MQKSNLHFVVDIDIKGFFDNVNHSKLIKQMWNIGIQDKKLLCVIKEMLKAFIVLPNGDTIYKVKERRKAESYRLYCPTLFLMNWTGG